MRKNSDFANCTDYVTFCLPIAGPQYEEAIPMIISKEILGFSAAAYAVLLLLWRPSAVMSFVR
jgi:hypothetical protein